MRQTKTKDPWRECKTCRERVHWSIKEKAGNIYRVRRGGELELIETYDDFICHHNQHTKEWRAQRIASQQKIRARIYAEGDFAELQFLEIIDAQGSKCAYCDKGFTDELPPTKDHIIPIKGGGTHTAENIVAACKRCNIAKNHVMHNVMYKQKRYYSQGKIRKDKSGQESLKKLRIWYIESTRRWIRSNVFRRKIANRG